MESPGLLSEAADRPPPRLPRGATEREFFRRDATLRLMLEQIPALVWTTNRALAITSCLGSVPEAVRPRAAGLPALAELFGASDRNPGWLAAHRRALAGERIDFEFAAGEHTFHARVVPKYRRGATTISGTVGAAHDITEYKRLEQSKNDFIAMVSHELRTPATSIHGALRLLSGRLAGVLTGEEGHLLEMAARNSETLTQLVGDLLDLQRIEAGRLTLAPRRVDLAELTREAVELNRPYAEPFGVLYVLVTPPPGPAVRGDPVRLRQVAANLLSNAAKFSPHGARVRIAVERRGEWARLSVRNGGPPIPADQRARLFEKFGTVGAVDSRLRGGSGLGLSISRALVQLHGGRIDCASDAEHGTEFWVELPVAGADAGDA